MRRCRRRRGSIYVVVLGVAMIVSVLAMGAMMVRRIERRTSDAGADVAEARRYAQAAIEMGKLRIKNDPDWRNTFSSGVWEADRPVGSGSYTLEGVDPGDNNLKNSDYDSLVLIGTGQKGLARQKLQVTLVPDGQGLSCLEVSLHAGSDLVFDETVVNGDQIISANNTIQAIGACQIYPDCEAVNGFVGAVEPGAKTDGIPPRDMPDSATLFEYYKTEGTWISISSLPTVDGTPTIAEAVLSPANNPYGTGDTNARGIYVIDCLSQRLDVRNSRIVGTLVLLNAGTDSSIYESVHWEPAVANYPSLLVQGTMAFRFTASPLDESALATNFNPPGTPYEGFEDGDTDDTYPSLIHGLVYVSSDAFAYDNTQTFDGAVIVGNTLQTNLGDTLNLTYQSTFLNNPPPGFEAKPIPMKISPGSWRQVVD